MALLTTFNAMVCSAAEWMVEADGSGEFESIQAAVDMAEVGDVIWLSDGVYRGAGNRNIDFGGKDLEVRSFSGRPEDCIVDCSTDSDSLLGRGFVFEQGETAASVIAGITIRLGQARGAKNPDDRGGAIRIANASPTIVNCVFIGNSAGTGGAISSYKSSSKISKCQFLQNTGTRGGAVFGFKSLLDVRNCIFRDNTATLGGAVMVRNSQLLIERCWLEKNLGERGGAIYVEACPEVRLEQCLLAKNMAILGAGAYVSRANLQIVGSVLLQNSAGSGGGIHGQDNATIGISTSLIGLSPQGEAIALGKESHVSANCSLIYGNTDGDWDGVFSAQVDRRDNVYGEPGLVEDDASFFGIRLDFSTLQNAKCLSEDLRWLEAGK